MSEAQTQLYKLAQQASLNAYARYSQFKVGAALVAHGQHHIGCNVENASYGLTQCAERNAIFTAVAQGVKPGAIKELAIYVATEDFVTPCGACRQVMAEFMPADAMVFSYNVNGEVKQWQVAELLPDGFKL